MTSPRIAYNATAAAAGVAVLPAAHAVLAVFLGSRPGATALGAAIATIGTTYLLDRRLNRWPTRFLLWAACLGCITDRPVLAAIVAYTTGGVL